MKAISCKQNQAKFDALNSKALDCLENEEKKILNSTGLKSERWCNPIIHPVSKDIAFIIKDRILPALTSAEKAEIIELTDDWFQNGAF